jgi:hypothetical protein
LAWDSGSASNAAVTGTITVPSNATQGSVRMRVGMTYYGLAGSGEIPLSCGTFDYGEFEDYCLNITNSNSVSISEDSAEIMVYPNPVQDVATIVNLKGGSTYAVIDPMGKMCLQGSQVSSGILQLNLRHLASGCYTLMIQDVSGMQFLKIVKN